MSRRNSRKKIFKKKLATRTLVKGFFILTAVWLGLMVVLMALGFQFEVERGCSSIFGLQGRCRPTFCGFARSLLPFLFDRVPCLALNVLPFLILPLFVLFLILRRAAAWLVRGHAEAWD